MLRERQAWQMPSAPVLASARPRGRPWSTLRAWRGGRELTLGQSRHGGQDAGNGEGLAPFVLPMTGADGNEEPTKRRSNGREKAVKQEPKASRDSGESHQKPHQKLHQHRPKVTPDGCRVFRVNVHTRIPGTVLYMYRDCSLYSTVID